MPRVASALTEPLETRRVPEIAPYTDVATASCSDSGTWLPTTRVAVNTRDEMAECRSRTVPTIRRSV